MGPSPLPESTAGEDAERDGRSARQWLKSARAYCLWRAGEDWRRVSDRKQRENSTRWYYLDGARFITDILYSESLGGLDTPSGGTSAPALIDLGP